MTKLVRLLSFSALGLFVCGSLACGGGSSSGAAPSVTIGALVDLSGVGSSLGNETLKAIYQAVDEAEARGVTIAVEVRDSQSEPAAAAQGAQELIASGIKTIIGPQSSSQVSEVLPIANAAGALVISTGSTASSLAIANDAVYRLVPTDKVESSAVFALMTARGRTSFVTVGRADTGNQGLINSLNGYARAAGRSTQPPISYPTNQTTGFDGIAQQITDAVGAASRDGSAKVGVFIAGFGEVSELLTSMASTGGLDGIALYAGDGSAQVDSVTASQAAATFASAADSLPSALTTIPAENFEEAVRITRAMGTTEPNAFALAAYDAVGIIEKAQEIVTVQSIPEPLSIYERFELAANGYQGVTGTIELDAAGDRMSAPYAFWGVCRSKEGTGYAWAPVAEWVPNSPSSQVGTARYFGCR